MRAEAFCRIPVHKRRSLTRAAERLVELYDAWRKKELADQWRQRMAEAAKVSAVEKKK
jgi:hypothetical protein